jgi:uncharacterized protein YjbI with pentapeptide repeats
MQQDARQRELEEQRAQDVALQAYLDQMGNLLLERNLRESEEGSEVRTLARARTLTVLARLDPSRKTAAMRFLVEAKLVQRVEETQPIINLSDADLSEVVLEGANLRGADLENADLSDAYLRFANLRDAYLTGNLEGANLSDADLSNADLGGTLIGADLSNADLLTGNLRDANLSGADLSNADLVTDRLFAGVEEDLKHGDVGYADLSNQALGLI